MNSSHQRKPDPQSKRGRLSPVESVVLGAEGSAVGNRRQLATLGMGFPLGSRHPETVGCALVLVGVEQGGTPANQMQTDAIRCNQMHADVTR